MVGEELKKRFRYKMKPTKAEINYLRSINLFCSLFKVQEENLLNSAFPAIIFLAFSETAAITLSTETSPTKSSIYQSRCSKEDTTPDTKESTKLKISAHQKPSTLNPGISLSASKMITALITNKKRPSVTRVTGMVSKTRMGFTIALSNPNTNENIIAVLKSAMLTPSSI